MKISKAFSLEAEDLIKFEKWIESKKLKNQSQAFRLLLKTAGVIKET